ncbi:hypothetical protein BJX66DRAFT_214287 [Aspergillus keveii]|uniref:HNH nuclease domain-containing protein n=1 Tax=Aspergillus keveii TaxID=714993 RepID=A0ABR4GLZ0_9EURO
MEIRNRSGSFCWSCETGTPRHIPVIGRNDLQYQLRTRAQLLQNFHLRSVENGLPLCPNCHTEFGRAHDPGFVFIPVDLEYFFRFEEKDKADRQDPARPGMMPRQRRVPTIQEYRQHLVDQKLIPAGAQYGYYRRTIS